MQSCLWDRAYKELLLLIGKSSPCGGSGFPLSLSEWSFTIIMSDAKWNELELFTINVYLFYSDHLSRLEETQRHLGV